MAIHAAISAQDLPAWPSVPRRRTRRFGGHLLLFAATLVLVNGLFGDRGLLETMRARRAYAAAVDDLARLRRENQTLRDRVRRLRDDPDAIEAVARGELGLVRPGEILVTVRDLSRPSR
jgi:cell division protein FtsB